MARVTDIRRALQAKLVGLGDLEVSVAPATAEYDAGPGFDKLGFAVTVLTGAPDDDESEIELDYLLDPQDGVKVALEEDRTLSGIIAYLSVTKSSGYLRFTRPEGERLGATWIVTVQT